MPNLLHKSSKYVLGRALVRIFAVCRTVGVYNNLTSPSLTFSLIKWRSISICLVQSWCTGFLIMFIAAWLSQHIFIGFSNGIFSSPSNLFNQIPSHIPCGTALYSAFALLRDTTTYFLLLQITRFPHTNVQYPEVERLSVNKPAQSASENNSMSLQAVFYFSWRTDPFLVSFSNTAVSYWLLSCVLQWDCS